MSPDVPEQRVRGNVGVREEVPTPTTPVALFQAGGEESDTLPVTGLNVLLQVILGGASLLGGGALFRRSRTA